MNHLGAAAVALVAFVFISGPDRTLRAGRRYRAVFALPRSARDSVGVLLAHLGEIMPPGATADSDGATLTVDFSAVKDTTLTDVETPLGLLKLRRLQEL